jgi:hypothetical protein
LFSYEIAAPVSELAAPIFCFLGCNWPSTQYSAVSHRVEDGMYVWRLGEMTLSALDYDTSKASPYNLGIQFGICGWAKGAVGAASVTALRSEVPQNPPPPPPPPPPVALKKAKAPREAKRPPPSTGKPCAFCASTLLVRNFTRRYRTKFGYTGPDFCGKCAQVVQRHLSATSPECKPTQRCRSAAPLGVKLGR